jgi:hypothetical protein
LRETELAREERWRNQEFLRWERERDKLLRDVDREKREKK